MPGMTFKSVSIAVLGLVAMAILSQFFGVFAAAPGAPFGTEAIPLTALLTFSLLLLVGGGIFAATRCRVLGPAEMLCVMYVLLLAAPLLTTGFWRFMLASSATVIKEGDWEHYDALSPMLWPHGADLMAGRLSNPQADGTSIAGNVHREKLAIAPGISREMSVLENTDPGTSSSVSIVFPVKAKGAIQLPLNEPYLLTLRARAQGLGAPSRYYVRLLYDDHATSDLELFSSSEQKKVTFLEPEGFSRRGLYGFILPNTIKDRVTVEVGLSGPGRLEIADLNFFNVSTLQGAFTGRRAVSREVYDRLPAAERTTLVVMPTSFFSWEGMQALIAGKIPWREWQGPILLWGGYISLLLAATFAVAALMRRQWVENERFALPLTQVPIKLAGLENQLREGASYLRNPYLWGGFGLMFIYTASNSLRFYFPSLPDLSVNIPLKSYLPDPSWGKTWEISFTLSGLFFALALFMDLNILFSLLVGFFLFRFQFWFGEAQGLTVDDAYPFPGEQNTGALLSYALLTLFVARRFLGGTLREAWRGGKTEEALSPRSAYLMLFAAFSGMSLLAWWAGLGVSGPLVLSVCIVLGLFVAMKVRAESGYPSSSFLFKYDGDQTLMFVFAIFGSLSFFNPSTAIFWGLFTMMFFNQSCFALVPGLQLELVALGHRLKVRRGDILWASVLGIGGGLAIGGWVYLSGAYAVGANNYPIVGQYGSLGGLGFLVNDAASRSASSSAGGGNFGGNWLDAHHLAFIFGAAVTTGLSVMRQLFAGFWFHPFGFIFGSSQMMQDAWGSILAAWAVRSGVLQLGGAITVRERLFPFAVGCVLAIVAVCFLVSLLHGYTYFFSPGGPKPTDRY